MPLPIRSAASLAGRRAVPLLWLLMAAEVALATRRHWRGVDQAARDELLGLVGKSKGKPSNLTPDERRRLLSLSREFHLFSLARDLATVAGTGRRSGRGRPG